MHPFDFVSGAVSQEFQPRVEYTFLNIPKR